MTTPADRPIPRGFFAPVLAGLTPGTTRVQVASALIRHLFGSEFEDAAVAALGDDLEMRLIRAAGESRPDPGADGSPPPAGAVDAEKLAAALDRLEDQLSSAITRHQSLMSDLAQRTEATRQSLLAEPSITHLAVDLPTGDLLFLPGVGIDGFEAGLAAKMGSLDPVELGDAPGERARAALFAAQAGFFEISGQPASADIYRDGDLLRLGFIDRCLPTAKPWPPILGNVGEESGHFTIIDRGTLEEILVASGRHDAASARQAVEVRLEEVEHARATVAPGPLHLYAAGLGESDYDHDGAFRVAGLRDFFLMEDRVVLSPVPLAEIDARMVREVEATAVPEETPAP